METLDGLLHPLNNMINNLTHVIASSEGGRIQMLPTSQQQGCKNVHMGREWKETEKQTAVGIGQ